MHGYRPHEIGAELPWRKRGVVGQIGSSATDWQETDRRVARAAMTRQTIADRAAPVAAVREPTLEPGVETNMGSPVEGGRPVGIKSHL